MTIISAMAATGMGALPGVMTGRMLAGLDRRQASKHQMPSMS